MTLDINQIRAQFPAFQQQDGGRTPIFLDNPAGTQVPQRVIDAMSDYFRNHNANSGGVFSTSQRTDQLKQSARETVAAFLNARRPEEIAFGPNMTTLTLNFSRSIGQKFEPGDEIIVTQMDHDANVYPWLLLAEDRGLTVRWVRLDVEDGTLDLKSYEAALTSRTRLVCFGHAANALGTINPVKKMTEMAHNAGAQVYIDAVQSAPHTLIDVQEMDVDYLACSPYKFYGPHAGILYGKYDLMDDIRAYKVRPAYDRMPDKWETGTGSYETVAGVKAAVEYIASLGEGDTLRTRLSSSYDRIIEYENNLTWMLIEGLKTLPGVELRGITDRERQTERVPTVIFRLDSHAPLEIAKFLANEGIYVWDGDYYALETMRALNHHEDGGMIRIGIAHYNNKEEIARTLEVLKKLG